MSASISQRSDALLSAPQLTPAWTPLRPHAKQSALYRSRRKFVVVVAGRGSGKSEVAKRRVVRYLPIKKPWPDPLYFYALPTRDQAKRVAWDALKGLTPPSWIAEVSETELSITTVFGSKLVLLGMDKPARAEGVQYDGGVVDECSDQRPGVFARSLGPALTHRDPWCWRIGVPKRAGPGAREFREAFDLGASGSDPDIESYTWPSSDILTPEQLRYFEENLDEKDFAEQFGACWERAGGLVFHAWDEALNSSDREYDPELPLFVGSDFNVDPMCWVIAQVRGRRMDVIDELFIRSTNTQATLDELHRRYGGHQAGFRFFGDASGRARHSSAAQSDYITIRSDSRFAKSRVFYPDSNPARMDRFASCNALFCSAAKERRLFVHRRCERLRKDLETRAFEEGCCEPDDSHPDSGHSTDALGYLVHGVFPISASLIGGESSNAVVVGRV